MENGTPYTAAQNLFSTGAAGGANELPSIGGLLDDQSTATRLMSLVDASIVDKAAAVAEAEAAAESSQGESNNIYTDYNGILSNVHSNVSSRPITPISPSMARINSNQVSVLVGEASATSSPISTNPGTPVARQLSGQLQRSMTDSRISSSSRTSVLQSPSNLKRMRTEPTAPLSMIRIPHIALDSLEATKASLAEIPEPSAHELVLKNLDGARAYKDAMEAALRAISQAEKSLQTLQSGATGILQAREQLSALEEKKKVTERSLVFATEQYNAIMNEMQKEAAAKNDFVARPLKPHEHLVTQGAMEQLLESIDQRESLDDDACQLLLALADEFLDEIVTNACDLALHRSSNTLEMKDIELCAERRWDIRSTDEDTEGKNRKKLRSDRYELRTDLIRQGNRQASDVQWRT